MWWYFRSSCNSTTRLEHLMHSKVSANGTFVSTFVNLRFFNIWVPTAAWNSFSMFHIGQLQVALDTAPDRPDFLYFADTEQYNADHSPSGVCCYELIPVIIDNSDNVL